MSFKYSNRERIIPKVENGRKIYMNNLRLQCKKNRIKSQIDKLNKYIDNVNLNDNPDNSALYYLKMLDKYLNRDFDWTDSQDSYENNDELKKITMEKINQLTDYDIEQSHKGLFCVLTKLVIELDRIFQRS